MDSDGDEILTIQELSDYLKVPVSTLYKLVREGSIPSFKVGKHWRFHKDAIDRWSREGSQSERVGERRTVAERSLKRGTELFAEYT